MKSKTIKSLAGFIDHLDRNGRFVLASKLDEVLNKLAEEQTDEGSFTDGFKEGLLTAIKILNTSDGDVETIKRTLEEAAGSVGAKVKVPEQITFPTDEIEEEKKPVNTKALEFAIGE